MQQEMQTRLKAFAIILVANGLIDLIDLLLPQISQNIVNSAGLSVIDVIFGLIVLPVYFGINALVVWLLKLKKFTFRYKFSVLSFGWSLYFCLYFMAKLLLDSAVMTLFFNSANAIGDVFSLVFVRYGITSIILFVTALLMAALCALVFRDFGKSKKAAQN